MKRENFLNTNNLSSNSNNNNNNYINSPTNKSNINNINMNNNDLDQSISINNSTKGDNSYNIKNKGSPTNINTFDDYNSNNKISFTQNLLASKYNEISKFEYDTLAGIKNIFANVSYKFSYSYILPVIYFFIAICTLIILILINFYKENFFSLEKFNIFKIKENHHFTQMDLKEIKKINSYFYPLPNFYKLKCVQPLFFSVAIGSLSLAGILNVWFYCSMFLQRFSVPEFRKNKIMIHFMFILGIISNALLIFLGFSPEIFIKDSIKFKEIKINFNTIIYLVFIFFNILFSIIGLKSLQFLKKQILCDDEWYNSKLKIKKFMLYLILFIMLIYISAVCIKNNQIKINRNFSDKTFERNNKKFSNEKIWTLFYYIVLCFSPYFLFVLNAFLNLGYYSDIIYLQKKLNTIIDKEYFYYNNEENCLLVNNSSNNE